MTSPAGPFPGVRGSHGTFREAYEAMDAAVGRVRPDLLPAARSLPYPQLHHACIDGDTELVRALLDVGIDADSLPYTGDGDDETALIWLARDLELPLEKKIAIATVLIQGGADITGTAPIHAALDAGDRAFAEFLQAVNAETTAGT